MNDDTLTTALDRMATALEPPISADELINARRSQLRRRRRVATGLTAASVFAIFATGGVVASSLGNADPAHNVPVTSDGPAPANAVDEVATDTEPEAEVRENKGPWGCRGGALTPQEIEEFRNEVLDEAQLNIDDAAGRTIHAYVVITEGGQAVYELKARRAGEGVEIVSLARCR